MGRTSEDLGDDYSATQEEEARRGLITAVWFDEHLASVESFAVAVGNKRPTHDLRAEHFGKYRMRRRGWIWSVCD